MDEEENQIRQQALEYARKHKTKRCAELTSTEIYLPELHPASVFMAGSPGAGKTESAREIIRLVEAARPGKGKVLHIDADALRSEFPGYNGSNSRLFQHAASSWVDRSHDCALKNRQSFILDGTLSDLDRARKNVTRSLGKGRDVLIVYVYQSPFLAWEFVQAREAAEGRNIPPERFIDQYFAARDVVNTLKAEFGSNIEVDLLLKPTTDPGGRKVVQGVDRIDTHVPERFTKAQLEAALGVQR